MFASKAVAYSSGVPYTVPSGKLLKGKHSSLFCINVSGKGKKKFYKADHMKNINLKSELLSEKNYINDIIFVKNW